MSKRIIPSELIIKQFKNIVDLHQSYRYSFDVALKEMPVEYYLELVKIANKILESSQKNQRIEKDENS